MEVRNVLNVVDLVYGLLSILSLNAQRITALFVVCSSSNGSLEIELASILILSRGWVVYSHYSTCAKVDLIVSVTVCVVLYGIDWRVGLSVVYIHGAFLLGLYCQTLHSIAMACPRVVLILTLLVGDVVHF
jgi:hypothetical protein